MAAQQGQGFGVFFSLLRLRTCSRRLLEPWLMVVSCRGREQGLCLHPLPSGPCRLLWTHGGRLPWGFLCLGTELRAGSLASAVRQEALRKVEADTWPAPHYYSAPETRNSRCKQLRSSWYFCRILTSRPRAASARTSPALLGPGCLVDIRWMPTVCQALCQALDYSKEQNKYLSSTHHIGLNRVSPPLIRVHPESGNVILFGKRVFAGVIS